MALVTLFRPQKLNALTEGMREELIAAFKTADQDDAGPPWDYPVIYCLRSGSLPNPDVPTD